MDKCTTVEELKNIVKEFTKKREWDKLLSPKTISIYLSLEAAELLEKFTFVDNNESKQVLIEKQDEIKQELADIAYWVMQMCWIYDIDLATSMREKIKSNAEKYPVHKAKGNITKYNQL